MIVLVSSRDDDGHAAPLSLFGKTFSLTFNSAGLLVMKNKAVRPASAVAGGEVPRVESN
jgi:hypothetical protein